MPFAYQTPDDSLARAHRRITHMLIHQYPASETPSDTPDASASVAAIIDLLDETIDTLNGLQNDVDAAMVKAVTTIGSFQQISSLPTSNIDLLGRIVRGSPVKIAAFDPTEITPIGMDNIKSRVEAISALNKSIIDNTVIDPQARMAPARRVESTRIAAAASKPIEMVKQMVKHITSKMAAASKTLVGSGLVYASNAF
jgi:hypothetical protein